MKIIQKRKRNCCFFKCPNNSNSHCLFSFPKVVLTDNLERCLNWVNSSRNDNLLDSHPLHLNNNKFVCSAHFSENQFAGISRRRLKNNSLPISNSIENERFNEKFSKYVEKIICDGNNKDLRSELNSCDTKAYRTTESCVPETSICTEASTSYKISDLNLTLELTETPTCDKPSMSNVSNFVKFKCAAKNCCNSNLNSTLHAFPSIYTTLNGTIHKDLSKIQRCMEWVQRSGNEELLSNDPSVLHNKKYLCNDHFAPMQFNQKMNTLLKTNAIPTIFNYHSICNAKMQIYCNRWQIPVMKHHYANQCDYIDAMSEYETGIVQDSKIIKNITMQTEQCVNNAEHVKGLSIESIAQNIIGLDNNNFLSYDAFSSVLEIEIPSTDYCVDPTAIADITDIEIPPIQYSLDSTGISDVTELECSEQSLNNNVTVNTECSEIQSLRIKDSRFQGTRKRHCCAKLCINNHNDRVLFAFPKVVNVNDLGNIQRCKTWIKGSGNEHLLDIPISLLYQKHYLCDKHFENKYLHKNAKRLTTQAVPTIFNCMSLPEELFTSFPKFDFADTVGSDNGNLIDNPQGTDEDIYDDFHKTFENDMASFSWTTCNNCNETFVQRQGRKLNCLHKRACKDFTAENNMDPGEQPDELKELSYIEEQLIARIHPVVSVYKLKGLQYAYSGNVINFPQNVSSFAKQLPHKLSDLSSIITVRKKNSAKCDIKYVDFNVRAGKVRDALIWLKNNNRYYIDIDICEENLNSLPQDANVFDDIQGFMTNEDNVEIIGEEESPDHDNDNGFNNIIESCIAKVFIPNQDEQIKNVIDWPQLGSQPIDEFKTEGYIAQAFPTLFPTGAGDLRCARDKLINPSNYFKHLFHYKDNRFSRHPRFRFFALNSLLRWNALNSGNVFVHKNNEFANMSVQQLKRKLLEQPSILKKIMFQGSNIKGSKAYWNARCNELKNMVEQIGIPTLFFTLSCADLHWPDLYKLLAPEEDVNNLNENKRRKLLQENPFIVDTFFMERYESFLKHVIIPKFTVKDYWFRVEYQHRGSPHIHGLLWLEDAPNVENLSDATDEYKEFVTKYFDKLVSTMHPNLSCPPADLHPCRKKLSEVTNLKEDLAELLNKVQRHTKCNKNYCLKYNKTTKKIQCRFKFPIDLCDASYLNFNDDGQAEFISARNDPLLNKFNEYLIQCWRANIDISPVVSKAALLNYISKYVSKAETKSEALEEIVEIIFAKTNSSDAAKKFIQKMLIHTSSDRDYSAQEVAHMLTGLKLFSAGARNFVTINFNHFEQWTILERQNQTSKSFIEKYQKRDDKFEHVSLFKMAQTYVLPSGKRHQKSAIVQVYPKVQIKGNIEDTEKFYKQQVLLHIPWRDIDEFHVIDNQTWEDVYKANALHLMNNDNLQMFNFCTELQEDENDNDDNTVQSSLDKEDWMKISEMRPDKDIQEVELGRREIDTSYNWNASFSLFEQYGDIKELSNFITNEKVKKHVNVLENVPNVDYTHEQSKVLSILNKQIHYIKTEESQQTKIPKRLIVQGKAGTGKSLLIHKMRQEIENNFGPDSYLILCPTGCAAQNINGCTIHSKLHIPCKYQELKQLEGAIARQFENDMEKILFIIFDEYSMIGTKLLSSIHKRLCQGKGNSAEPFGGLYVYMFGDIRQLPPVCDKPLYKPIIDANDMCNVKGKLLFDEFEGSVTLTQSKRQTDVIFANILENIGTGNITDDDYTALQRRFITNVSKQEIDFFKDCIHLFPTNNKVKAYNFEKLKQLKCIITRNPVPIARIPAIHNNDTAKNSSTEDAEGLESVLYLSKGCKVMLKSNLWTSKGLVNGSIGSIVDILYNDSSSAPDNSPSVLICMFDTYTGPCLGNTKFIPIPPLTRTWTSTSGISCSRTQFPVCLAYATSIHKSQGITVEKVYVDLGDKEMQLGLSYVALSRCKTLSGLLLKPFTKKRLKSINQSQSMLIRKAAEQIILSKLLY